MKNSLRFLLAAAVVAVSTLAGFGLGQQSAQAEAAQIVVDTPTAPHPKARIRSVDFEAGAVRFDWLKADGTPADSGDSLARFTVTGSSITAEQKAILAAAITAATAQP